MDVQLETQCPFCAFEGAISSSYKLPEPGDYSVCVKCGELVTFDDRQRMRKPTKEERDYIGEEVIEHAREAWLALMDGKELSPKQQETAEVVRDGLGMAMKIGNEYFKGRDPVLVGLCLAELTGRWLAGHNPEIRESIFQKHLAGIRQLTEANDEELGFWKANDNRRESMQ